MEHAAWPAISHGEWTATKTTLQLCAQMIGKARLALAPPRPEWLHAALLLDGRGFTTGAIPLDDRLVSMGIDVYEVSLWIDVSDGSRVAVPLGPGRCVADIWADFAGALVGLGIDVDIWEKPQEVADTTPFSENTHDGTIVAEHAQRFYQLLASVNGAFEEFRSPFFGRSGVQLWWGGFDFSVLLFNGRHMPAPDDRGYIMRYDLDAEHMSAGFWSGDDNTPASFYAYLTPRPEGCESASVEPDYAGWTEAMGQWLMPYEAVRTSDEPRQAILSFLNSVYRVAIERGGWDAEAHEYVRPEPSAR